MSRYNIELAGPEDDAALRDVLAQTPMAGRISVAFAREPSFFSAGAVEGRFHQVVVGRDQYDRSIVGFGVRSIGERYVNGRPAAIGYLSGLRILARHRSGPLLARGYRFFRELHADARTQLYLTTVAEGNRTAREILTSGRCGLPAYHAAGRYQTLALAVPRTRVECINSHGLSIRPATADDLETMISFLNTHGPTRQFFPIYRYDDFQGECGLLRGLSPDDVLLCHRGSKLAGLLAGWNQQGFRQTVVCGYSGALRWLRPAYNVWARLAGRIELPAPGRSVQSLTAALPVVAENDPRVFQTLLCALFERARTQSADCVLLGMHEADPLWRSVRNLGGVRYTTNLYIVCWEDGETAFRRLDDRVPYLELGSL